jgi:hypothetical protein
MQIVREVQMSTKTQRPFLSRKLALAILSISSFFVALPSESQVSGGTISGLVSDRSGAVLPDAAIVITNVATGVTRKAQTNRDGLYSAPNLVPGPYKVKASPSGFATVESKIAKLDVGGELVVNLVTQIGAVTETINVSTAEAAAVDTTSSTISGLVSGSRIRELPLNARDWTQLAALEPGVATVKTQVGLNSGKTQRGLGQQMTVSGGRPQQNNYRLDGISINDYSNGAPGSVAGVELGVDAIDEFSVLTSTYPAEYGRSSGGVINAVTRSGTNELHGSAFEFIRNSALDARNYFDSTKPSFRRNQFGASAGGPIIKNRTFIFGAYEGLRESLGVTQQQTVFTADALAGRPSTLDPTAPSIVPNVAAVAFAKAFYPLPNGDILPGGQIGLFNFSGQRVTHENFFTTKMDHHFSEQNSLTGTYVIDLGDILQPDELNDKKTGFTTKRQFLGIEDTEQFRPNLVNSVRAGINRIVAQSGLTSASTNPAISDPQYGAVPGRPAPDTLIPGLTEFTGGLGGLSSYDFHWTSFQGYDDAFLTKGLHTIKFGIAAERIRDNSTSATDFNGVFAFNSLTDFLTNTPLSFTATIPGTLTERGFRQSIYGVYVNDDWRVRPNLNINAGLRYELSTVPTESKNHLTTLRSLTDSTPHLGSPLFSNPTLKNFEPRLGFSWQPFAKGTTAVRGGFGLFDVLPLPYEIQLLESFAAPYLQVGVTTSVPVGTFPNNAYPSISSSQNQLRQTYFDPHPKRNYVMQYNLNIQHEFTEHLGLLVGYVGSRGLHQPYRTEDADIVLPTKVGNDYIWPLATADTTPQRLNENWGQVAALFWIGRSYYDAVQVQLKQRSYHGLQFQGSYTMAKSIDTSSASVVGDSYGNSVSSLPFFNPRLSRGLSDFAIHDSVVINATYEVPAFKKALGLTRVALNGWEASTIFLASTGTPFTVSYAGDPLGLNSTDPSLDVPDVLQIPGCKSLVKPGNPRNYVKTECLSVALKPANIADALCNPASPAGTCLNLRGHLQRNSLIGPGIQNLDFSLVKNTKVPSISEAANIQFRAEFFNVLNHTNFAPPLNNSAVFDGGGNPVAGAGRIDSTTTTSRQIQFGLKVLW